jgi:manganese transport protein
MNAQDKSLIDVHQSVETNAHKNPFRKLLSFFGPAYLVSVGYMDPGNWATDIEGGSRYGFKLVWILLLSNIMALVLQSLCARLGVVYKRDLAQANRDTYPKIVNIPLYILAEIAIAATDLAEVIGMALGIQLLFGIPLMYGVLITLADTFLLLYLQQLGIRRMEAFIIALVTIIFACFAIQLFIVKPDITEIAKGIIPSLPDKQALYIAIGIIGATVMPHNLYLHSALVQTRKIGDSDEEIKRAIKLNTIDSAVALNLALFVNAAILIVAGSLFYYKTNQHVAGITEAHQLMAPLVGSALAPTLFAIALIAAGQSSTITGTLAGQIVMEGYLHLRINPWIRRLITRAVAIVPAIIVIWYFGESKVNELLVFSQVILSLQLGFAVIPLIIFVSDKNKMKHFAIKPWLLTLAIIIVGIILSLNIKYIISLATDYLTKSNNTLGNFVVIIGLLFFVALLVATIILPFVSKPKHISSIHAAKKEMEEIHIPNNECIAIALDFSDMDSKVISYALQQGNNDTSFVLIHIIESAPAKILGANTDDTETGSDKAQLQLYADTLIAKGYKAKIEFGYRNRAQEIARIAKEQNANLLVLGAHGHTGFLDFLYGETINKVRHLVTVPVLVVK